MLVNIAVFLLFLLLLKFFKQLLSDSVSTGCLVLQAEVSSGLQWSQSEPLLDLLQ